MPGIDQLIETERRMAVAKGWGEGGTEIYCFMNIASVLQDKESSGDGLGGGGGRFC